LAAARRCTAAQAKIGVKERHRQATRGGGGGGE